MLALWYYFASAISGAPRLSSPLPTLQPYRFRGCAHQSAGTFITTAACYDAFQNHLSKSLFKITIQNLHSLLSSQTDWLTDWLTDGWRGGRTDQLTDRRRDITTHGWEGASKKGMSDERRGNLWGWSWAKLEFLQGCILQKISKPKTTINSNNSLYQRTDRIINHYQKIMKRIMVRDGR